MYQWNSIITFCSREVALRLCRYPLLVNTFPLLVIWCDMFSLGWTPSPLSSFWRQDSDWKSLPTHWTQHVQMRCKLLAAAPLILFCKQDILPLICTPSLSYVPLPLLSPLPFSLLLPSSPLSPLLSFPPSPFSFSFNSHVSPPPSILLFSSSIFSYSLPPSPTPLPFSLPDTPLHCAAGVRMLRRDRHSLS